MRIRLEKVAGLLSTDNLLDVEWSRLRFEHVTALKTALGEQGLSPAAVNSTLYAIRGVCRACWNLGLMTAEDFHRIREVKPLKAKRLPKGRALCQNEVHALVSVCQRDGSARGLRDLALLAVLYTTGIRRAEVVALSLNDFDAERNSLKVLGKGNQERLVYLSHGARLALDGWLRVRGGEPGALFLPVNRNGTIADRRLSHQSVYAILKRRAKEAGLKSFSTHDFRRTFVGNLLSLGIDIATVQKMAGHANVSTTARYDRRGEEEKARAAALLEFPIPALPDLCQGEES